jgi:hypothetical protein
MKVYYLIGAVVVLLTLAGLGWGVALTDPDGQGHLRGSWPLVVLTLALVAFALAGTPVTSVAD